MFLQLKPISGIRDRLVSIVLMPCMFVQVVKSIFGPLSDELGEFQCGLGEQLQLGESIEELGEFERQKEAVSGFLVVLLKDTCLNCYGSLKFEF